MGEGEHPTGLQTNNSDARLLAEMDFATRQGEAGYDIDVATYNRIMDTGGVHAAKLARLASDGLITVDGKDLSQADD